MVKFFQCYHGSVRKSTRRNTGEIASGLECKEHGSVLYFRNFLGKKYSKIDSTNSHNSAHPMDIDGVPSFNLHQADEQDCFHC